jgi:hypothetical protein
VIDYSTTPPIFKTGATSRIRTEDLHFTKVLLYH